MNKHDIIRAWKDEAYREALSESERARLPEHPAGLIELSQSDLEGVMGAWPTDNCTNGCTGWACVLTAVSITGCAVSYLAC